MENMNIGSDNGSDEIPQRAVSLYGQNEGVDDFPVLKAFQQYIDAEQEKARKRILGLGVFFGAVLVIVIAVFMILLHGINMRNQSLSDRLVEYAMKEADRRQQQTPANSPVVRQDDSAMKAMTETLLALQKKIESSNANADKARSEKTINDLAAQQESLRLQRLQNQLEAEKKLLADERERLRQSEIERQRRKLYPELYGAADKTKSPARVRTLTDEDIREIIKEAYPDDGRGDSKSLSTKSVKEPTASEVEDWVANDEDDAIEYFKDDEYSIPVDVKGADSKVRFTVPVD